MKGVRITQETYSNVKLLLTDGYSRKKVSQITGLSGGTVCKIDNSENWDDYCGVKPVPDPVEQKPTVMTHDQITILQRHIDKTNELLEQILAVMKKYMEV